MKTKPTLKPKLLPLDFCQPSGAIFSEDRLHRYALWRSFSTLLTTTPRYAMFIGLNPSTADETNDDPTIRRCIDYTKRWGLDAYVMTNLFAYRATDPEVMKKAEDPVGPQNDRYLIELAKSAGIVIACWGNHGAFKDRAAHIKPLIPNLQCLVLTKTGEPGHPLYLGKNLMPFSLE